MTRRSTSTADPRAWATQAVQWDPARNSLKRGAHAYARARGAVLEGLGRVPAIANIYAASAQKAGSQWMKALFHHPLVRARTELFTLPQLDYKLAPPKAFPAGTFVPGLYLSHPDYARLEHRHPHRLVYMFRDPRDLIVSGYWSAVKTHRRGHLEEVEVMRDQLRTLPFEEGLLRLIESARPVLDDVATWIDVEDETVIKARLEDVSADARTEVSHILHHCGIELPDRELESLLRDVSRASLQAKDLAQRGDGESHYRLEATSFRDVFTSEHYDAVEAVAPGLTARLGYPA